MSYTSTCLLATWTRLLFIVIKKDNRSAEFLLEFT